MDDEKTVVVFRYWTGDYEYDNGNVGNVIALFPYEKQGDVPALCSSYEHFGQHGGTDFVHCLACSRSASWTDYDFLAKELEGLGYDLDIRETDQLDESQIVR